MEPAMTLPSSRLPWRYCPRQGHEPAHAAETAWGVSLYKALSGEGNLSFGTILKVMHALGLKLAAPGHGLEPENAVAPACTAF